MVVNSEFVFYPIKNSLLFLTLWGKLTGDSARFLVAAENLRLTPKSHFKEPSVGLSANNANPTCQLQTNI